MNEGVHAVLYSTYSILYSVGKPNGMSPTVFRIRIQNADPDTACKLRQFFHNILSLLPYFLNRFLIFPTQKFSMEIFYIKKFSSQPTGRHLKFLEVK